MINVNLKMLTVSIDVLFHPRSQTSAPPMVSQPIDLAIPNKTGSQQLEGCSWTINSDGKLLSNWNFHQQP